MPLKLVPLTQVSFACSAISPGISQQDLARKLDMHASRLVAMIDALEERALVVREANAQDRRIYSLRLTDAGEEMCVPSARWREFLTKRYASGWSLRSAAALAGLLQRIAARHEPTPGVHPGYKDLRVAPK